MRLLLIRHGQTPDNVRGAIGTVLPGPGLTELGQVQADAVVAALANEPIEAIYVSTMLRTRLTAEPLSAALGLDINVVDGLQEIVAGDLEGHTDTDSIHLYMGTIFSWWQDFDGRIPGGEDGNEFYQRFTGAIERIAAEHATGSDKTIAIFSHGAAIRTWASWSSRNIDAEASRAHVLPNTGVVILEGSPAEGWFVVDWAGQPVGGARLDDPSAPDPTGESE